MEQLYTGFRVGYVAEYVNANDETYCEEIDIDNACNLMDAVNTYYTVYGKERDGSEHAIYDDSDKVMADRHCDFFNSMLDAWVEKSGNTWYEVYDYVTGEVLKIYTLLWEAAMKAEHEIKYNSRKLHIHAWKNPYNPEIVHTYNETEILYSM